MGGASPLAGVTSLCETYHPAQSYSELETLELPELSGLTPSGLYPDLLWAHNDSGNASILYALHTSGALLATLELPLPQPGRSDLEDIDTAPCPRQPARPCLWVSDTGDNDEERSDVAVYVVPEPSLNVSLTPPFTEEVVRLRLDESELVTLRVAYEEGPADVEALVVESNGEALWLFEKVESRDTRVWRYVLDLDLLMFDPRPPRATLSAVTRFPAPGVPIDRGRLITAADLSPDGLRLALRVYTGVYVYWLPTPNLISALPQLAPDQVRLGPLSEPQGEALCYDEDYTLWSASEANSSPQVLTQQTCSDE